MSYKIQENDNWKKLESETVNYIFNKNNGFTATWGKTLDDDPNWCQYGPMILDIEVSTICRGPGGKLCKFCYKSNTPNGKNMSFETFKNIIDKMPKTLTQVAFGSDAQCESNPDIWKMMEYCRSKGIVPNITVADISDEVADNLAKYCGAVAVSKYDDKDLCYNSIKKLTDRGMNQINIHYMISEETYDSAIDMINDYNNDPRLEKLNAIVFLSLKQKGRGTSFNVLSQDKFNILVDKLIENNVSFGFDSCSAHKYITYIKDKPELEKTKVYIEPCESSCFSSYIDTDGDFYPCSFHENIDDFIKGISVIKCDDFIKDIWNNAKTETFRKKLLKNNRECPIYKI